MSVEKLRRTTYRDPTSPGNPLRTGDVARAEADLDVSQYEQPLERVHGAALHGPGVASGLKVTATLGAAGLQVLPGVVLDGLGRHVSLAAGGLAEVGPGADSPGVPPSLVPVTAAGVTLDTAGVTGMKYVTVEYRETFDSNANLSTGAFQYDHTPWLRLVDPAGFTDDGTRLVLAQVVLDAGPNAGKVIGLTGSLRRGTSLSASKLRFQQAFQTASGTAISADTAEVGSVQPRAAGGINVAADTVALQTASGNDAWVFDDVKGSMTRPGPGSVAFGQTILSDTTGNTGLTVLNPAKVVVMSQFVGLGVSDPAFRLETLGRVRVRQANDGDAGLWLFQKGPNANRAFVGMANDDQVGLFGATGANWGLVMDTTSGYVGLGVSAPGFRFDVLGRIRLRQATDTAGLWLFQKEPNADRAFVGMAGDNQVGLWGNTGAGWGLVMDTTSGNVGLGVAAPQAKLEIMANQPGQIGLNVTGTFAGLCAHNPSSGSFAVLAPGGGAAHFQGNVQVTGTLSKGSGTFKIDHPLDPENKFLVHSLVESPDMLNVYTGTAETGDDARVTVTLPPYFEALNCDVRYQVTPVGQLALAAVIREVEHNAFVIATDKPHVKVCWSVTGVRQDAYARAHPIEVEPEKTGIERGHYLHPAEHKVSISKHGWKAHVRQVFGHDPDKSPRRDLPSK